MTKRELINICLEFPYVYEDYPFDLLTETPDAWTVMRHKGNRKGFAHIFDRDGRPVINLKLPPCEGDLFRQVFEGIKPAYHMNKEHWNSVYPDGDIPPELLRGLIEKSYELTKPRLKEGPETAEALRVFKSSIAKCEKARTKLKEGSPQRKWVDRQLEAFYIAVALIEKLPKQYVKSEQEAARGTLKLLIEKCEKLQGKFVELSPQRTLAGRRLKAFEMAVALINAAILLEL